MLHSVVIGHNHDNIDSLTAQLQSPASTCHGDRCGSAPEAAFRPARSDAFAVTASDTDGNLQHGGDDGDTLRIAHHLVRNCFVRSSHNFIQNLGGCIETFVYVRLIFVISRPCHTGAEQKTSTEY